ncbi:peptidase [Pikeienuella piscinae]|uniref:Peptidase n=1 Tax=Pikeienuella piscinae TaxID=2748098 RepID=A0A7L5BSV3_9RHOB|nr:peptidase [Pikeienuella piscinae]QIE54112.1 peptidase [Pikeienuella piscinae]
MTYCVGLKLDAGIVMMSDTRTNAGLDNISRFRKMFNWNDPGERVLVACCAGNLSITQGVLSRINAAIARSQDDERVETILNAQTLFRSAQLFGDAMRDVQARHRETLQAQGAGADASILLAGQRKDGEMRLYLIYSAGNFIEATPDTPFLQIGEHKYGKPILDRVITPETPLDQALKAVFLSMDSTLRSNLSVGMPLDLTVIRADELDFAVQRRIEAEDEDFSAISRGWADAIREAFETLPSVNGDGR